MPIERWRRKERPLDYLEIRQIAEYSYAVVAVKCGFEKKNIHTLGACWFVCPDLEDRLTRASYNAWIVHHDLDSKYDTDADFEHEFIIVENVILDPTWQQFLETPREDLPKLLIIEKDKLAQTLTHYGVAKKFHHIWLDEV